VYAFQEKTQQWVTVRPGYFTSTYPQAWKEMGIEKLRIVLPNVSMTEALYLFGMEIKTLNEEYRGGQAAFYLNWSPASDRYIITKINAKKREGAKLDVFLYKTLWGGPAG